MMNNTNVNYGFNKEQINQLREETSKVFDKIGKGVKCEDILAQMYVENFPDKTIDQGRTIAKKIIGHVRSFNADYKEAMEDLDGFLEKFKNTINENKTLEERADYWLKIGTVVNKAKELSASNEEVDYNKIMEEIENMYVSDPTEEKAEQLSKQAIENISNYGDMFTGLYATEDVLNKMMEFDEAAEILLDIGDESVDYKAIISMLAYIKVEKGDFKNIPNIPANSTAEYVTDITCAAVEQEIVLNKLGKGEITVERAAEAIGIIGSIIITTIFCIAIIPGSILLAQTLPIFIAAPLIPILIVILIFGSEVVSTVWEKFSYIAVKGVTATVKNIVKGIGKLVNFISEKIKNKYTSKSNDIFESERAGSMGANSNMENYEEDCEEDYDLALN